MHPGNLVPHAAPSRVRDRGVLLRTSPRDRARTEVCTEVCIVVCTVAARSE